MAGQAPVRKRLRWAGTCVCCGTELPAGTEAIWMPSERKVACLFCAAPAPTDDPGHAGASALREHERRLARREEQARAKAGRLGVWVTRLSDEPQHIRSWRQGGQGELKAGDRLGQLLMGSSVLLLHDRRVPSRGRANIDHISVGPGGVTVIDTKTHKGRIRVESVGGLLSPRRAILRIGGRDQTKLIEGVEQQLEDVRRVLAGVASEAVDVRGALCFPNTEGLPTFSRLSMRGIVIGGTRRIADLARREGSLNSTEINVIAHSLARALPTA